MAASSKPGRVAFFEESTQGTGPADAAAWASASPGDHEFISATIETIRVPRLPNENMVDRVFGKNDMVEGIENVEVTTEHYFTSNGVETTATNQITETATMQCFEYGLGGLWRGYSTTCSGGTATIPQLTDNTGVDEGTFWGFEDQDDPGRVHIRRVTSWSDPAATLDEALPFTPASGDPVHACWVAYIDEAALFVGQSGYTTWSVLFDQTRGVGHADDIYEINGARGELSFSGLGRGEIPRFSLLHKAGSFQRDHISGPTWVGAPYGVAPTRVTGPDSHVWLQDYGTTTQNSVCATSLAVEVGVPVVPIESITALNVNMPGLCGYGTVNTDTTVELTTLFDSGYKDDVDAGQMKVMRWQIVDAPGSCIALHFSNLEYMEDHTVPGYSALSIVCVPSDAEGAYAKGKQDRQPAHFCYEDER